MKKTNNEQRATFSRLACALVASMVTASVMGAAQPPSLVLGIFVEGLTSDNLDLLRDVFAADGGLRRLVEKGVRIDNVDFGPRADATAAVATLMTGASPVVNGIPGAKAYDVKRKVEYPILANVGTGDFSNASFSPQALLVSTLSDEIRVSTDGAGSVHSLAPDAEMAVLLAGHAGNSAHWLDENNGRWATSAFYTDHPVPVIRRNTLTPLTQRLDTITWKPYIDAALYPELPDYKRQFAFKHTFKPKDADRFAAFKASPMGNREITQTAMDYIESLSLGSRGIVDVLNLGYDVTPYPYGQDADVRMESMDAYLRLDADLSQLFKAIDKTGPGMDRTVVFVAGLPQEASYPRTPDVLHIPTGQFSPQRAISLLNLYLVALHGNGEYVTGYYDGYFYLNRELARQREMSLQNLRSEAADFLARMSGVSETFTIDDVRAGRAGDQGEKLRANTSVRHSGDVLVLVNPGWEITDDIDEPTVKSPKKKKTSTRPGTVIRAAATTAPVLILAPSVEPHEITEPIDARAIAPTIARTLHIRSPNAATVPAIRLIN